MEELLKKIIDLGYSVNFGMAWNKDGYTIEINSLFGFKTKYKEKSYEKCTELEEGLKKVYEDVNS